MNLETKSKNRYWVSKYLVELLFRVAKLETGGGSSQDVSATESGIVNNTALQELGGVDKLINNIRIGKGAGNDNRSIALGFEALYNINNTGPNNVAIGYTSMHSNTIGGFNIGLGGYTLYRNISGEVNIAIGPEALYNNTSGSRNIAIGATNLYNLTTGSSNIAIGLGAGTNLTNGIGNILVGSASTFTGPSFGSNNLIIAPGAEGINTPIDQGSNNIVLGNINNSTEVLSTLDNNIIFATGDGGANSIKARFNGTNWTFKGQINKTALDVAPASASAIGTTGEIRITSTHIYVCVSTNTWVRTALTTW